MPPKESDYLEDIGAGSLYMLVDGEYEKVDTNMTYEITESTDIVRIVPRKYSYYVRIKMLLWSIRTWLKWKLHIDRCTITWIKLEPNESIPAPIITPHKRKGEKE